ncbi:hypothetical protein [Gracilibacillus sp. YIM 98692]|uniref:hypothetical protein n=1 Tax=Gracilibacillus sp. YIM 98692 TaxID=2663532 RepID=UPI0013D2BC8F|nr:hypothetical protein [Gracilibacillus sp. YIM 98692]
MKVIVIGNEAETQEHLSFWETKEDVIVERTIVMDEKKIDLLPNPFALEDHVDLIDICVSTELKPIILKKLRGSIPIVVASPIAPIIHKIKDVLAFIKEQQMQVFITTPLMASPEFSQAHAIIANQQLGKSGVNRISLKSDHKDRMLEQGMNLLDWIYRTFGDFQTIYAKQIDKKTDTKNLEYKIIHIRHVDGSFTHLEMAQGFGKEELNLEFAGAKGMLSNKSGETIPITMNLAEEGRVSINPTGKSLATRQLESLYQKLFNKQETLDRSIEMEHVLYFADAIEKSLQQQMPVTKGDDNLVEDRNY